MLHKSSFFDNGYWYYCELISTVLPFKLYIYLVPLFREK